MDEKAYPDGHVTVWAIPRSAVTNLWAIPADVINSQGINISHAISWADTTLPTASASDDIDDRSIMDRGNATSRGAMNYEASLTLFYPGVFGDTSSEYRQVWDMFRETRVPMVLVTRVLQNPQYEATDMEAGQFYSAYDMMNSTYRNNTDGDDSVKYTVGFMTQGNMAIEAIASATEFQVTSDARTIQVGEHDRVHAVHDESVIITSACKWESSDSSIAAVSQMGVITGIAEGEATISVTHPSFVGHVAEISVTVF